VLVATAALASALVACSSSNPATGTSAPPVSSSSSAASSTSPAPAAFVGTWRSNEGNVLVVRKTDFGYAATLYTDGAQSLQDTLRERAASLVSMGSSSVVRWKLSWDVGLSQLVLSDDPRGVLMFSRISSSTASPSPQQ
jgi:hypothetical protein